jgi:transcriptional repressor NrdR
MLCPDCQHTETKVLDSRASGGGIRRRRQCLRCERRFTTHERIERKLPLVVKKDGTRAPFDQDKLMAGFRLACRKRPVSAAALEAACAEVEANAMTHANAGEVHSADLGKLVLAKLHKLDTVAYVRFASVYMEVDSADDFLEILRPIAEREPR